MKVLVAGAGVGGLTTAVALRKHNIRVEVLEAAPALKSAGGGLGLASNATKVLSSIGIDLPGTGIGQVCTRFHVRTARGGDIREIPIRSISEELGSPVVNVRRRDLLALLSDSLGDAPVHYGTRVARYDHNGSRVAVTLTDGSVHTGDVLIGADGIRSTVRAQTAGPEPVLNHGYVCWIATTTFAHPRLPSGGAAHYWGRGQRFGLIDVGGGLVYWWGTRNNPGRDSLRWEGCKTDILRYYSGWAPEVRAVIKRTPEREILTVPAEDRAFREDWGTGPVTLVGDAAHPMLTSLSQGAGAAIEDGHALAHHLAAGGDAVAGVRRYEAARRDRTQWLVAESRRLSRLEQIANPVVAALRDLAIRFAPSRVVHDLNIAPMRYELPARPTTEETIQ